MIVNTELSRSTGHLSKDLWETPPKIYNPLNEEFKFTLDPCCTPETEKCAKFYTPKEDGLIQDWAGEICFVNPPYSRGNIDLWMEKCYNESRSGTKIVALIPVSHSANWYHEFVWMKAQTRPFRGRIRFVGAPFTAPFSSELALYNMPAEEYEERIWTNACNATKENILTVFNSFSPSEVIPPSFIRNTPNPEFQ